jgi:hypothetical protein
MLRRSFLAGVPVLVLVGSTGCDGGAPVVSTYELSGIVSERFESGMDLTPLAGVAVTFTSDTGMAFSATTGDDGRYRMQIESEVDFGQVRASLAGFQTTETTVLFDVPARRIDLDMRRERG